MITDYGIIQGVSVPVMVIDTKHRVVHFNKACEALTGISAAEIIGTTDQWRAFYAHKRPVLADAILDTNSEKKIAKYYPGKYKKSTMVPGAYEAVDFFPDLGDNGKWLFFTASPLTREDGAVIGAVETLQDITEEKRAGQLNKSLLRISTSIQHYADIDSLLDYISYEIRCLLETEGALVILFDESRDEFYFKGASYEESGIEARVRNLTFSRNEIAAHQVLATGQPLIVNKTASGTFPRRDTKLGYTTRNFIETPLKKGSAVIGVLNGINKKEGSFTQQDTDILTSIAGTVELAIDKARMADQLAKAYHDVKSLNEAKNKAINHLGHELKTPTAILGGALDLLEDDLKALDNESWKDTLKMLRKNVRRVADIQQETADIIVPDNTAKHHTAKAIYDLAATDIASLAALISGKPGIAHTLKKTIDSLYLPTPKDSDRIDAGPFIRQCLDDIHREINEGAFNRNLTLRIEPGTSFCILIPADVLEKIVTGLIKNSIENTPDGGTIVIGYGIKSRSEISVSDSGRGVAPEDIPRLFEGFHPSGNDLLYTTGQPYAFNAGGKGADLLRMKIFSEHYNFDIQMTSEPCRFIKNDTYQCPGNIRNCTQISHEKDCDKFGGTRVTLCFPDAQGSC